jgi:hypothetical protein
MDTPSLYNGQFFYPSVLFDLNTSVVDKLSKLLFWHFGKRLCLTSLRPFQLGIRKMTPAGLLVGAQSIVCHNKHLRTEMKELERELETLQGQNQFMVSWPGREKHACYYGDVACWNAV